MNNNTLPKGAAGSASLYSTSILGEDELSIIFSNHCVTTRDLMNFRFVNKIWRNAATTTLLQRNACYLALDMKIIAVGDDVNDDCHGIKLFFCKYGDKQAKLNELSNLTKLMSASPKFPTSNIHVHSCCYSVTNYADFPDLMLFFKLHGEKIKTFRPHGCISLEKLWDISLTYAPTLKCLDLGQAVLILTDQQEIASTSKLLSIESLAFPFSFSKNTETGRGILRLLLSSSSNLGCIKHVELSTLPLVLAEGKGHIIRSFKYSTINITVDTSVSLLKQFSALSPKLSKLTLEIDNSNLFDATLPLINELIESSADSLQTLKLCMYLSQFCHRIGLKIPRIKNLKCITLSGTIWECLFKENQKEKRQLAPAVYENCFFQANCFPSLIKVSFKDQDFSSENNILYFLQSLDKDDSTRSFCLQNVETLQLQNSTLPQISHPNLITKTFPNIRILKIIWNWLDAESLKAAFWKICPLVELIEICDISFDEMNISMSCDYKFIIDSFFTGFTVEICKVLQMANYQKPVDNSMMNQLLRSNPSVCDLQNLKELKLRFHRRLWTEFASRVTGDFAFAEMANTKFIISYDPEIFCCCRVPDQFENEADKARCFKLIRPYVQVVQEKQNYYKI